MPPAWVEPVTVQTVIVSKKTPSVHYREVSVTRSAMNSSARLSTGLASSLADVSPMDRSAPTAPFAHLLEIDGYV